MEQGASEGCARTELSQFEATPRQFLAEHCPAQRTSCPPCQPGQSQMRVKCSWPFDKKYLAAWLSSRKIHACTSSLFPTMQSSATGVLFCNNAAKLAFSGGLQRMNGYPGAFHWRQTVAGQVVVTRPSGWGELNSPKANCPGSVLRAVTPRCK